ncbi:uncharacterized protein LOC136082704 [Hydra vulgaris]|uniref:Uncharacterized protein LOC136082704 n=1 Tax=Hydra vulgaris TaxID=6087 RepID=A0ABM4C987_HYDVU
MARGYSVNALYLDYEKAFNTPPHDLILHKLSGYGISDMLLNWIISFLSKRTQRFVMGFTITDSLPVTSGVPQESVEGPFLFILYINDIKNLVSSPMRLYADDSKVNSTNSTPERPALLQMDRNHIVLWTQTCRLRLNYKKCLFLRFNKSKNPNHQYYILTHQGKQLHDSSYSERDLGICILHNLKWDTHVEILSSKANSVLGQLKKSFIYKNAQVWKRLNARWSDLTLSMLLL